MLGGEFLDDKSRELDVKVCLLHSSFPHFSMLVRIQGYGKVAAALEDFKIVGQAGAGTHGHVSRF